MIKSVYRPSYRKKGKRVYKRIYWGQYRIDPGDPLTRLSLGTTDKRVAQAKLDKIVKQIELERAGLAAPTEQVEAARASIIDLLQEYVRDLRARGRSEQYISKVRSRITTLVEACGWTALMHVSPGAFVAWRAEQDKAPKTLNHYLDAINAFMGWLVSIDKSPSNPFAKVAKVETRGRATTERRAFTDDEIRRLLEVSGPRRPIYLAAVQTGLRHNELRQLRWGDVHLDTDQPCLHVRASTTKNKKNAVVWLVGELADALRTLRPSQPDPAAKVFSDGMPSHHTFQRDLIKADIEKLDSEGRKVDFHALRHTLATNLARAGVPQRLAMEIMRHSDPRLTANVYTDANALPTRAAVQQLPGFTSPQEKGVQVGAQGSHPNGREQSQDDKPDPPAEQLSLFSGRNRGRE